MMPFEPKQQIFTAFDRVPIKRRYNKRWLIIYTRYAREVLNQIAPLVPYLNNSHLRIVEQVFDCELAWQRKNYTEFIREVKYLAYCVKF
jgi:hypothetical protein